jgi:glycosyltransferase involved in cell wall biosynthesis
MSEPVRNTTCRVSVVIPTCKRPDLLQRCLDALAIQDLDPTEFEVIVVDDAACESTRQQVANWIAQASADRSLFRYLPVTGAHGPAAARNLGWRAARSDLIAFTDDDCLPCPQWLRAGLEAFTEETVGVSGKLIIPLDHTPTDYEHNAALLAKAEFITANCFYRRDALAAIGGFDERFTKAWREDSDLIFSLMKASASQDCAAFVHAPQAVVVHPIRPASWHVSLQQQRKSQFNALLYKKHPRLYRQHIQSAPPFHYYGIVVCFLAALLFLCLGLWVIAACAFALWVLLTVRFFLRRLRFTSRAPSHILAMLITSLLIPPLAIFWRIVGAIRFKVFFL